MSALPPSSAAGAMPENTLPLSPQPLDISFSEEALPVLQSGFAAYGDAFRMHAPLIGKDVYVLSHPRHARHVLVDHHANYTKGLGLERVGILLGNGIMVSEGELWRRQRKMIQPAFHASVLSSMVKHITEANARLAARWEQQAVRGETVNLTQDMSEVTLDIVLRAIFGADVEALAAPFAILTSDTERNLAFAYKFRSLSKIIAACVARRREAGAEEADFLGLLMASRDRKSGDAMAERQLLDEVMTLIVAGHETTASALNWMWYLLSQHPEAEAAVQAEADAAAGTAFDMSLPGRLPYTRQVVEETLRLYPPGWLLTRRAIADDTIDGHALAAGSEVFVSPYLIHRHPEFWPDAERFDPARFAADASAARDRFAYLPFALGPRACIGEQFAMAEMLMHAAALAHRFRLRYLPQQPIALECQVNLRPLHDLMMTPELRNA